MAECVEEDPDIGTDSADTEVGVWMQAQVSKPPSHVGAEVGIEGFFDGLSIVLGHRSRGMYVMMVGELVSCE